jgi:hypothetical protein
VVSGVPTSFGVIRRAEHDTNGRLQIPLIAAVDWRDWALPLADPGIATRLLIQELATTSLLIKIFSTGAVALALARVLDSDYDREREREREHHLARALARALALALDHALDHVLDHVHDHDHDLNLVLVRALDPDREREREHLARAGDRTLARARKANTQRVARRAASLIATHFLSEGCYPDLRNSSPVLGLPIVEGEFVAGRLTAPLAADFEMTGNTVRLLGGWSAPAWLNDLAYDLVAPLTLQPLGGLPQQVPEWGRNRTLRAVGLLPFLMARAIKFDQLRKALPKVGFPEEFVRSGSLLLLIPGDALLRRPFADWDRDRDDQHVVSALWDVPHDRVLWAEGFHNRDSIRTTGRPLDDWLKD